MNDLRDATLTCTKLGVTVPGRKLVSDLDLNIAAGEIVATDLPQQGAGRRLAVIDLQRNPFGTVGWR